MREIDPQVVYVPIARDPALRIRLFSHAFMASGSPDHPSCIRSGGGGGPAVLTNLKIYDI